MSRQPIDPIFEGQTVQEVYWTVIQMEKTKHWKEYIFFVRLWELTQYTSMVLYPYCLHSQDSLKGPFQNLTLMCPTHPAGTLPHLEGTSLSAHHLHCTQCLAYHYGCDLLLKIRYHMLWHNKYHCVTQSHMSVCSWLIWWIAYEEWLNLLHTKA